MTAAEDIVRIEGGRIAFLDVVRGLKSEAERVFRAFESVAPDVLAMSVSTEEIKGMRDYAEDPYEVDMSRYEELYAKYLSRFGDVFLPPPCFLAGMEAADRSGVDIIGIDMDDETHTAAYCALVSGYDLFRHTTRFNFIKLKRFNSKTPAEFVIQWDRTVNSLRGFRELEREREEFMARELKKIQSKEKSCLALVDVERAENVRRLLTERK